MFEVVMSPTRVRESKTSFILDLVLTGDVNNVAWSHFEPWLFGQKQSCSNGIWLSILAQYHWWKLFQWSISMNLITTMNFVQSLRPLAGMTYLQNCLLTICGHVFILDLKFCWINTVPTQHGWLNWYWEKYWRNLVQNFDVNPEFLEICMR